MAAGFTVGASPLFIGGGLEFDLNFYTTGGSSFGGDIRSKALTINNNQGLESIFGFNAISSVSHIEISLYIQ